MSLRWFIYWCALCGGWAALVGWVPGRLAYPPGSGASPVVESAVKGMFLGLLLALGLGLVDAIWNLGLRRIGLVVVRVSTAVVVGALGGLLGGAVGQMLYDAFGKSLILLIFGWVITGLLIGLSIGVFEIIAALGERANLRGAVRKSLNGIIGGSVGGFVGGILYLLLGWLLSKLFANKESLLSPSAVGFVVLGMCIGLFVATAQVVLREAWVRVEKGFRAGRELLLTKGITTVGRAESCDIGLFGDSGVEKLHAKILQKDGGYYLADNGTPGGTWVNDTLISEPVLLKSGDLIRMGKSMLRFGERQKKK